MPVAMHARDKTSYKIILNQLNKVGKKLNRKFVLSEIDRDTMGGELMHTVIIYEKPIEEINEGWNLN